MKKQSNPLGQHHADSIKRNSQVPAASKGFPNSTPGNTDKSILHTPDRDGWHQEKPK